MGTKSRQRRERLPELPAVMTVAVIDDDEGVRLILRTFLKELGHQVSEFPDAQSFLQQLEADRIEPHLIFLDHFMPGLTGLDLSRGLADTMLPIVMVTSVEDQALLREMGRQRWLIDFIEKPINKKELLKRFPFICGTAERQIGEAIHTQQAEQGVENQKILNRARGVLELKGYNDNAAEQFLIAGANNYPGGAITKLEFAKRLIAAATPAELKGVVSQVAEREAMDQLEAETTAVSSKANESKQP